MGAVEIAGALAAARKAVRLYPPEHPTHREAVEALTRTVNESVDVRPLVLNLQNGRLYEGSEILTEASPATRALAEAMEVRRVESLTFHVGFTRDDSEGLSDVLSLKPSPELQVQAELEARGVRGVTVSELEDTSALVSEERDRRREGDRALYRATLSALKNVTTGLAEGTEITSVEITRALALLIERVGEDPNAIVALASMSGHGERWRFHAAGVMLYALVLGHRLGLSDSQLLALGTAALLHDVGDVLPNLQGAAGSGDDHPVIGAQALGALPDEDCFAVLVSFEHHMGVDGSGGPARAPEYVTHPFSRIVAVVNRYDNLTRPTEGLPMLPADAAAQLLREASGGPLDPIIARVFVQAIGVFPVTSVVRLSDKSVGIVRATGEDPLRPTIRLVLAADGHELRPAPDIDLNEDERRIAEVVPARLFDMLPADYL